MNIKNNWCGFALILFVALMLFGSADAFARGKKSTSRADNPRYASLVMDADTGLILHQRYADKTLHPASLTKVMTLIMLFDAIDQGKISLNDRIYISKHAAAASPSKIGLPAGSSIKVKDAILAMVTKSANDIAVAMGEKIGGTESNFAKLMTAKAQSMGMRSTQFKNASGLHNPGQVTTARDMAKMAQILIKAYPQYYDYFSTRSFTYAGKTYRNHNRLMETYKGMDGLKTGYVNASGFNLIASAVRNNRRVIGVVFGGRTTQSRNDHMAALLDQGFSKMNDMRIAHAEAPLPSRKPFSNLALNKTATLEDEIIGEGDYDPAATQQFDALKAQQQTQVLAALPPMQPATAGWGIQIGAFTSRAATDNALRLAQQNLPEPYGRAQPVIAPLKTNDGWIFRARLSGYTQDQAYTACAYIKDCMPVAPAN